ncbi:urease accessory protein UreF [Acinetobacter ursingii]|uniref:urease accessory protein UreF n=1 Tax=Acinetobacter ursingii TaxID=108980 RepID=UPI00124CA65E|nr:urease accessory UreF family protein [Acinetobacter ursingii]MCU4351137.1 urease accessory protein [Acinetobacter ursingii]MCU4382695.1 urease accessory protein [Acinetobacter ursingii]MDI3238100.1 urease accessory UreF family protein [Acinetobacter ursingii]MDU4392907.1 urease accessory UreF family protein [Acinetobacter ursingii]
MSINAAQLLKLLTLSSTALPVGAYCYSQGVESAIETGLIQDEVSSMAYFEEVLEMLLVRFELPVLKRLVQSYADDTQFLHWANLYKASRESKELLAESQQLAFSLNAWIKDVLKMPVEVKKQFGFVPVYAQLCGRLGLNEADVLTAYSFSVLENQVLAAVKTVPLGQMSGQRILWHLHSLVPQAVEQALALQDDELSSALPRYAMLSMQHETQYSRLFRS